MNTEATNPDWLLEDEIILPPGRSGNVHFHGLSGIGDSFIKKSKTFFERESLVRKNGALQPQWSLDVPAYNLARFQVRILTPDEGPCAEPSLQG